MPGTLPTSLTASTPVPEVRSQSVNALLAQALELIAAKSPAIACPILDSALAAGTITRAEHAAILSELVGAIELRSLPPSDAGLRLRHQVRAAIGRAAPSLARPLLDEAVASARLTPSQEVRILQRLRRGALSPVSSFR